MKELDEIANVDDLYRITEELQQNSEKYLKYSEKYNAKVRQFLDKKRKYDLNIAVVGYKGPVGCWDPSDCKNGLPGSEECAVYATNELARRNIRVTVFMQPPMKSIWKSPFSNPRWLELDYFNNSRFKETYDIVILWRRLDFLSFRHRLNPGGKCYFWPHDSPTFTNNSFSGCDGILFLSQHHRQQFLNTNPVVNRIPYIISGNGLVLDQFFEPSTLTNKYSIGYFSNYSRGLAILINLWPKIRQEFPKATLEIYYGRETWGTMRKEDLEMLTEAIESYESLGVKEVGKVGHEELAIAMRNLSVWAYPCITESETFCITAVKTQAAGMIPVTTRIGALNETVHTDAPSIPYIRDNNDMWAYENMLLTTLRNIDSFDRSKYIEFGKSFSWEACIDKWLNFFR